MSLLNIENEVPKTPVEKKAIRLKKQAQHIFATLLTQWENSIKLLWDDENPQAILDQFESDGNSSVELFTRSAELVQFLESQKPGCTALIISKVRPFEVVNNKIVIT